VDEITGTVTELGTRPHGELLVTLDNGHVWAEIGTSSKIKLKVGDTVKIERGSLGSFLLVAPNGRSSRVTRVR
jgi:superfamily I DNA and RNA helicase